MVTIVSSSTTQQSLLSVFAHTFLSSALCNVGGGGGGDDGDDGGSSERGGA